MANEADIADISSEMYLAAARMRRKPTLPYTGRCHNCDHEIAPSTHFCDDECRDDFDRRERARGMA